MPSMNFLSTFLSLIATVFYVIGAIGYSDDKDVLKNVAWIQMEQSGVDGYYGLREIYITGQGQNLQQGYKDCASASNSCEKCEDDGKGAFALCIIGAIVALVTTIVTASLPKQDAFVMKIVSVLLAAGACVAGIIAISLFMGDCYDEIDDNSPVDLEWGPGAVLTIIAMFLMAGVSIVQLLSTFVCKS